MEGQKSRASAIEQKGTTQCQKTKFAHGKKEKNRDQRNKSSPESSLEVALAAAAGAATAAELDMVVERDGREAESFITMATGGYLKWERKKFKSSSALASQVVILSKNKNGFLKRENS